MEVGLIFSGGELTSLPSNILCIELSHLIIPPAFPTVPEFTPAGANIFIQYRRLAYALSPEVTKAAA